MCSTVTSAPSLHWQATEPHGLTYNWNLAYKMFKAQPKYTALFFVNNDIVFANGTFTRMAEVR